MSIITKGPITRLYIEIENIDFDDERKNITCIVMRLGQDEWVKLEGISLNANGSFILPEPIGSSCTISDISNRQWCDAKYEIEFASSYERDGIFWSKKISRLSNFQTREINEYN